jgi:hypothetical protein
MAKTEITKIRPNTDLAMPDYLRQEQNLGTQDLNDYIVPPRMKVVQKQSDDKLLSSFGAGDIIIVPNMQAVAALERDTKGRPTGDAPGFKFVPLFFFPEWCTWNPIEMKGNLLAIRERTLDPKSRLAMLARDADHRVASCPENANYKIKHVEHLNFLVMLVDHELSGQPIVMSFARAEHAAGRRLASLIKMRKAPIFGCVFEGHSAQRSNQQGDWWGVDVTNPSVETSPWVPQDQFEVFKQLHSELQAAHESSKLRVNYDDPQEGPTIDATSTEY